MVVVVVRVTVPIVLDSGVEASLRVMSRAVSADYRSVVRARIILLLAEGCSYDEVQAELGVSRNAVSKWKKRFLSGGVDGLVDAPRSGKPRVYGEADIARVVEMACRKNDDDTVSGDGEGYTSMSQRRIASELGMSQSTVHKILADHDLKPHKVDYWCGKSTDPEFEQKMLAVVGLYLDPGENAVVLSVDEKTGMQALDRSQAELPMKSGSPKRQTVTYKRHGTVSLLAALAVHDGDITAETIDRNDAVTFLKFLKKLERKYRGKDLCIIADNHSIHKQKDVKKWVNSKKHVTMYYTPTYSSWLNQIEIWFNILTKDVLKGGIWKSKKQLTDQILRYIETYNKKRAKPFTWTYTGKKNSHPTNKSQH